MFKSGSVTEALVRNLLRGYIPAYGQFTIEYSNGYMVFNWPGGKSTRMFTSGDGVTPVIPLPDGKQLRIELGASIYGLAA